MIIPEVVRIGSCDYSVEYTDENIVVDHKECYADINYDNHAIRINNNIGDIQQKELSFLHEMFHGIVADRAIEVEDEELVVEELAKGLHQVIRDNPEMFLDDSYFEEKQGCTNPYIESNEEETDVQTDK